MLATHGLGTTPRKFVSGSQLRRIERGRLRRYVDAEEENGRA